MTAESVRPQRPGARGGTQSADRVADVLLLFAQADHPLGVSRIARELRLSKAVVHRILRSLVSRSLLQAGSGDGAYSIGPAATTLSQKAWSQLDLRTVASPILRKLRDRTRETTTLSVLVGNQRIYLEQFEGPQEVKMVVEIGPPFALHSGASSRAILAFLPESFTEAAVAQRRQMDPTFDESAYRAQLGKNRRDGYAVSQNERNTGASSIAAPFFDPAGSVMGSITSSGPMFRYGEDTYKSHVPLVIEAARSITTALRD